MGRTNRFVKPEVVRLEISDSDWIEIKKELSAGEQKEMFAKSINQMGGVMGEEPTWNMDAVSLSFGKVETYLVDWSLAEENGKGDVTPVEISPESIRALDQPTFDEIEEAIDKHIESKEKEKKATGGKRKSAKT
jgi:hypothetical protein